MTNGAACRFSRRLLCPVVSTRLFVPDLLYPVQTRSFGVASSFRQDIIFSGIQPSGIPHIGNYLGALREWVRIQNEAPASTQLYFCLADLHALTSKQNAEVLRRNIKESLAALLAVGLDPTRCVIFRQSAIPEHAELMWILSCMTSTGHLTRMTQWKSKTASDAGSPNFTAGEKPKLGLLSYPVLQAADILLYGTTHVPVGEDQVQHLELTRDIVESFNSSFGDLFVKPGTLISPMRRVMSLKDPRLKMSKSHAHSQSRIHITDSPADIALKIDMALTDSENRVTYETSARPGVSNLLEVFCSFDNEGRKPAEMAEDCRGMSMRDFKKRLADLLGAVLAPIRSKHQMLMDDDHLKILEDVERTGAIRAHKVAYEKMQQVRKATGLSRP